MSRENKIFGTLRLWLCGVLILFASSSAFGQGSIFGTIHNQNDSVPAAGEISFFGYLDDTDEEVRLESSIGAGYDAGNWYDDFQNYLTEAPGNPYDYHFYNIANGEGFVLSKLIPNNSFQQENIVLESVSWPVAPGGLSGHTLSSSSVLISWEGQPDLTYHVYRRTATSDGSFFRIDDPSGSLLNPGLSEAYFVDAGVDGVSSYDYVVIAEDASSNLGPHSEILTVNSASVEGPIITDINPNIGISPGGTPVTVTGSGFDPTGVTVTIGGSPLASVVIVSPFEITGETPPGSVGAADVEVTNTASGLSSTLTDGFTYITNNSPVVSNIPDQTIDEGQSFTTIELDDYVSDADNTDAEISWTATGMINLEVTIDEDRIATITPLDPEWNDSETITFRATDPGSLFDEDAATFTVNPVNDAPLVADIPDQPIDEGQSFATIELDDYVSDADNTDAEISWTATGMINLEVTIDEDRIATITPLDPEWNDSETITFRATDPGSLFDEDAATFTVNPVNDPPVVSNIPNQTIPEGETFSAITLDDYVEDVDNSDSEMTWTFSGNIELIVDIDIDRIATISMPSSDWNGSETITFRATDPGSLFAEDAATFAVSADNDSPIVSDIPGQPIDEGQAFATIDLDDYVDDIDNDDSEMIWTATGMVHLEVSIDEGRTATITPLDPDWNGSETITFRATDPGLLFDEDEATFTINPVNDAPVAENIPGQIIDEGQSFTSIDLDDYVNDVDNTDDEMTWSYTGNTDLIIAIDEDRIATITIPHSEWNGSETIIFRATDPGDLFDEDAAVFTVNAVNDPPVLAAIGAKSVLEGGILSFTTMAYDQDGTVPFLSASPLLDNADFTDHRDGTGTFTFEPDYTQQGEHDVIFYADDGEFKDSEVVTIEVINVNLPPVLNPIGSKTVAEDSNLNFTITASDPEGTLPAITATGLPDNSVLVDNHDGTALFVFNPDHTQAGVYEIIFFASDGDLIDSEVVSINVTDASRAPQLDEISDWMVPEDSTLSFLITASDPDGTYPILSASPLPAHASFVDSGNGKGLFTFSPDFNQANTYEITFKAADNQDINLFDTSTISITVTNVNQAPVWAALPDTSIVEQGSLCLTVSATDPDGTLPSLETGDLPDGATFIDNGNGTGKFVFEPIIGQAGDYQILFLASDEIDEGQDALVDTFEITIAVTDVNRPPAVISPIGGIVVLDRSPLLDWTDMAGANRYEVIMDFNPEFTSIRRHYEGPASEWIVSPDLLLQPWYWKVRAHYPSGWSAWSVTGNFWVCGTPQMPELVRPTNGATGISQSVSFDWNDVGGAVLYELQLLETELIVDTQVAVSSFSITGLEINTEYTWRIKAKNSCDIWGPWSGYWSFTTLCPLLAPPLLAEPSNGSTIEVADLSWQNLSEAINYRIQIDSNLLFNDPQADSIMATNELIIADLANYENYYWRVSAENNCGWGNWSEIWSFELDDQTDADDGHDNPVPTEFALFQNYPNPFNASCRIDYSIGKRSHVRLEIINIAGELVTTLVNKIQSPGIYSEYWSGIDNSGKNVSSGLYFYRLKAGTYNNTRKLLMIK